MRRLFFALLPLLVPAALRAQDAPNALAKSSSFFHGSATAWGGHSSDYRTNSGSTAFSVSAARDGAYSHLQGNGAAGTMKMELVTNDSWSNQASGDMQWSFTARFLHTGLGYLQPVQLFFDGMFDTPSDELTRGHASAQASVEVYAPGDDLVAYEYLGAESDTGADTRGVHESATTFFAVSGGKVGTWTTYTFVYNLGGSATAGWDLNFGHTVHAYLPRMTGQTWETDGVLGEQTRPAWAAGQTLPGEISAVPAPSTVVLVLTGGAALLGVGRRRVRIG